MAKFYSPGPNYIFAGLGDNDSYLHLGFTDDTVEISTGVEHAKVSADFAGGAGGMAADFQFMGEDIVVSFRLSAYNESVLTLCRQRLDTSLSTAPGMGLPGALGALIRSEGNYYSLVIQSAYGNSARSGKQVFSDMTPGFIIPQAFMAGDTTQKLGVPVKNPTVVFRAVATFADQSGFGLDGRYLLFHSDFTGIQLPSFD